MFSARYYCSYAVFALAFTTTQPAYSQSALELRPGDICVAPGVLSFEKLRKRTRTEIDPNDFFKGNGDFDIRGYRAKLKTDSFILRSFQSDLQKGGGRFYRVAGGGSNANGFNLSRWIDTAGKSQTIHCVGFNGQTPPAAQRRAAVSTALKKVGNKLIVRRDLANLSKSLRTAAPAVFSVDSDRVAENTSFQSRIAIATEIVMDLGFDPQDPGSVETATPVFLLPYLRHVGVFNTSDRIRDVDNLAAGLLASLYAGPVTSWLNTDVFVSSEYLTDTVNDKQIFAGEAVIRPYSSAAGTWPIDLGQKIYFDPIAGGPYVWFNLDARGRYGFVEDSGDVATIRSREEYLRVGLAASARLNLGGSDVFSGFSLYANYLYFYNITEATDLNELFKFEGGVQYNFTDNFGLGVSYHKGRNEDTLQEIDRIMASLTVKFGEREEIGGGPPSLTD